MLFSAQCFLRSPLLLFEAEALEPKRKGRSVESRPGLDLPAGFAGLEIFEFAVN
jgi:hypothetical protein